MGKVQVLWFCFGKQCRYFSALHRKLTAQSEMNLFRNCLVFTLLYFTILALSPFTFPGCFLSPKVTKLEEGGVLFSSSQLTENQPLLSESCSSYLETLWVRPALALGVVLGFNQIIFQTLHCGMKELRFLSFSSLHWVFRYPQTCSHITFLNLVVLICSSSNCDSFYHLHPHAQNTWTISKVFQPSGPQSLPSIW